MGGTYIAKQAANCQETGLTENAGPKPARDCYLWLVFFASLFQYNPSMRAAWLCLVLAVNVAQAQDPCSACHPREVEGYRRSAMAVSLGRPAGHPGGSFT